MPSSFLNPHTHTHTPHQMPTRCCVKNRISSGALFRTKRFSTPKLLIIFQKFPLLPFPSTLRIHFLHVIWCQPQFTCFYVLFPFSTFVLNYYVCSKLQKENWFFSGRVCQLGFFKPWSSRIDYILKILTSKISLVFI